MRAENCKLMFPQSHNNPHVGHKWDPIIPQHPTHPFRGGVVWYWLSGKTGEPGDGTNGNT